MTFTIYIFGVGADRFDLTHSCYWSDSLLVADCGAVSIL